MFSYRKALPMPPALDPNAIAPLSYSSPRTGRTGEATRTSGGMKKAYGQEITALLMDDTPLTRECLSISLNLCDRGLHVLTAASVADVEAMLGGATAPDVVMCHFSGTASTDPHVHAKLSRLVALLEDTPLIILADREEAGAALDAFRLGVRGYIPTTVGLSVALEAIRLVGAGGTFIPTTFLQRIMQDETTAPEPPNGPERAISEQAVRGDDRKNGLTPRQIAVLKCMREGKANKIIAHELGMCESTVKVHVRNILKKLGATNRTQAVYLTFNEHPLN